MAKENTEALYSLDTSPRKARMQQSTLVAIKTRRVETTLVSEGAGSRRRSGEVGAAAGGHANEVEKISSWNSRLLYKLI